MSMKSLPGGCPIIHSLLHTHQQTLIPPPFLPSTSTPTHDTSPPHKHIQIEHRLFPGLPSDKLPLLAPVVKATCHDFGVHYQEFAVRVLLSLVSGVCMGAAVCVCWSLDVSYGVCFHRRQ